jgi:protein TonB
MNFALPQQRTDRHPVGLVVVIGLHALLAAVLVSARLANKPGEPPPAVLTPLDPVKPAEPKPQKLPDPVRPRLPTLVIPTPIIPTDPPPEAIAAKVDDQPQKADVVVAAVGKHDDDSVRSVARVLARAARINAGAAQCRPDYPAAAQRAGATGVTRIRFSVDASGRIAGSQILQSSGTTRENRMMDKAAAEALAQCPVQVGTDETGRPVGTTTDVEYVWTLN